MLMFLKGTPSTTHSTDTPTNKARRQPERRKHNKNATNCNKNVCTILITMSLKGCFVYITDVINLRLFDKTC